MTVRAIAKVILQCAVTATLVGFLIATIGWRQIFMALSAADITLVVIAASVGLVARYLEARQMAAVMTCIGLPLAPRRIVLANSLSALYAMIVPGDLLASTAKWWDLSAATGRKSEVLAAMVYNRTMLLLPWLVLSVAGLAINNPFGGPGVVFGGAVVVVALATGILVAIHPPTRQRARQLMVRSVENYLPLWISGRVGRLIAAVDSVSEFSLWFHATVLARSMFAATASAISFVVMAKAAGVDAPAWLLVWVRALIIMLRLLPISFNGIGVREATMVTVLGRYGVDQAVAFGFGMLSFLNLILFATVGLCYQVALNLGYSASDGDPTAEAASERSSDTAPSDSNQPSHRAA